MFNRHFYLISAVCLAAIAGLSSGQQFGENVVENQEFDYEEQQNFGPTPTPTRFQSKPQPSSFRSKTSFASAPQPSAPRTPPVAILKQINRHNEDGSYTYGFEGGDGSFKIETKLANGEVKGKYGYVDDSGKVRVVEYGANQYGFQPSGEGITVAPPTLVDESKQKKKKVPAGPLSGFAIPVNEESPEYDDGQYSEEPQPQQQQFQQQQQQFQPQPSRSAPRPVQPRGRPAPRPAAPVAIQRPNANFEFGTSSNGDFSSFQEQSFGDPSRASSGPAPPRIQVPGAVPVSGPAPSRIVVPGAAPVPSSRSSQQQPRPAPQFLYQPAPQARQAPRAAARQYSSSSFDELEKQYALPSGGSAATHDISFSGAF